MQASKDFIERRQYDRAYTKNLLVAILNTEEPVTIGLINDISLGGVKFTYELTMMPSDSPIHSIDLIAESRHLVDIPCEYAWSVEIERQSRPDLKDLRQCGIKFGRLNPSQVFLLRSLINSCTNHGIRTIASNILISCTY